ncbi:hypothetical protein WOSG25_041360 [Weissella oryzae SG25]|uniref:Uncharacterized protein n=1 Tax=Weissella oryzae (strain DSM 25784 / JCM 18191 / LMG 30913 / SG25) TaxID=1329250 RepID=A0A069CS95_WEIOS|nr:hypothetical protein [Weissella oryzae]GAK30695.1 hypothetical protein WOSG25_041360 [Weissella oryzae SG25]
MTRKIYLVAIALIFILGIIGGTFIYVSSHQISSNKTVSAKINNSNSQSGVKISNSSSTTSVHNSTGSAAASSNKTVSSTETTSKEPSTTNISKDTNTLSGFINTYGMTPAAWLVQNKGMSTEEALLATPDSMETTGELQTEYSYIHSK